MESVIIADRDEQARMLQAMEMLVQRLSTLADEQVRKKVSIEDRWFEDLRQYHGRYDPTTESQLKAAKKSQLFVNLTRSKTLAWEARLSDMLFPTDDRNWGIQPTPVPEMIGSAKQATDAAIKMVEQANMAMTQGNPQQAVDAANAGQEHANAAAEAKAAMDEARTRAEAMEREIDDQFRESGYNTEARMVIHDACKLGTGIMKGPVGSAKMKRTWQVGPEGEYILSEISDPRPDWKRVDPWSYFPDMTAARPDQREFDFQRHLMTKTDLRKIAKLPGFDANAIRALLKEESPREGLPQYVNRLRAMTGTGQDTDDNRFHVWEYHGPITADEMRTLCSCTGDAEMAEEVTADPLDEYRVIVWFCQDRLLKFGMHHMDSGESVYSVFNLEKDDQSVFGFGTPYLMRDSQKALNGGWRMMMDNAGLSTGPQIVINQQVIEPADGKWELAPRKIWLVKDKSVPISNAFGAFNIDSRQGELMAIISAAKEFADDETNLPLVAQGESGAHQTQTAQGMSMLMNATNVVFRRVVKSFDDDFTIPNVTRAYDWNMQFSDKAEIKGDFAIDARGSSVLLVREVQANNLMAIATNWTAHPVLGGMVKAAELARKTVQAHMLSSDELIKSDEEIQQQQQAAAQQQQQDPRAVDNQTKMEIAKLDADTRLQVAQINHETTMGRTAEERNMHSIDTQSKERTFAAELGVKAKMGTGI